MKGQLEAMATVHVDDVLLAGGDVAEPIWKELQGRLTFGSWAPMSDGLKFLGRHVVQDPQSQEITTSMAEYCSDLQEIVIAATDPDDRTLKYWPSRNPSWMIPTMPCVAGCLARSSCRTG